MAVSVAGVSVVGVAVVTTAPAAALGDHGAAAGSEESAGSGELRYTKPVSAPVSRRFHLPEGHYGPGTRGLRYATAAGSTAVAIASGTVSFAGAVAGRLAVTVDHADGRRSSLTGLAATLVVAGDVVPRGAPLGVTGNEVHLGVREHGRYIDPATLFAPSGPARLVPVGSGPAWGSDDRLV